MSIWLAMDGVSNCCHIAENNRRIQWILVFVIVLGFLGERYRGALWCVVVRGAG